MQNFEELKREIENIKKRNQDVELNKSWETSVTRRVTLMLCTYLVLGFYMNVINVSEPWLNAIVPTVGFMLSTLTLSLLKKVWVRYLYKK